MIVFIVGLFFVVVISIRKKDSSSTMCYEFQKDETASINGIFSIVIFLGHVTQYFELNDNIWNKVFIFIMGQIGQLCVTTFLFYSGYGVMESICKSDKYIDSMFQNRILTTLANFDIAILLFLFMNTVLGIGYSAKTYLGALTGADSVGNSNWYIFSILCMYLASYISGKIVKPNLIPYIQFVFTLAFFLMLKYVFGFPSRFYSTIFCYSLGMLYSMHKEKLNNLYRKGRLQMFVCLMAVFLISIIMGIRRTDFSYNIHSCLFCVCIVLIMLNLRIESKALLWIGKHCFSLYILQRIPMIILSTCTSINHIPVLFTLVSFILLFILLYPFEKIINFVDTKIKGIK